MSTDALVLQASIVNRTLHVYMMLYMYIWFVILCGLYFALFNVLIAVCDILFIILIYTIYLDALFVYSGLSYSVLLLNVIVVKFFGDTRQ